MSAGDVLGALSLVIVLGAGAAWFRGLRAVTLEGRRGLFLALFGLATLLGAAAFPGDPGAPGTAAAVVGLLGGGVFCLLGAFSGQARVVPQVRVGRPIPDFTAPDAEGAPFALSSLHGRPFLLKFFRGHW